jgi:hypothetical protein
MHCFIFRPESVAKAMMHVIERGSNGSVWVAEGGQPVFECHIPGRETFSVDQDRHMNIKV